ncbi:Protein dispatched [Strongyloides ratti]|uniref:Protein dispatched n=1 Tax=Strongyloides ratti TaxID=34506 RepID=A0A090LG76_STRRB|nr:Protein dispatched [Strongyloides ratti]CEF68791.1 Protein dispatched [Strongyloides ratti]
MSTQQTTFTGTSGIKNNWYRNLLIKYPEVIILFFLFATAIIIPINFWIYDLPTFSNPIKGFSTQNTFISRQSATSRLLQKAILKSNGGFTLIPQFTYQEIVHWKQLIKQNNFFSNVTFDNFNVKNSRDIKVHKNSRHMSVKKRKKKNTSLLETLKIESIHNFGKIVVKNHDIGSYESLKFFCSLPKILEKVGIIISKKCNITEKCNNIVSLKLLYAYIYNYFNESKIKQNICELENEKWKGMKEKIISCLEMNCIEGVIENFKKILLTDKYIINDVSLIIILENKNEIRKRINKEKVDLLEKELKTSLLAFDFDVKEKLFVDTLLTDVPYGILGALLVFIVLIFSSESIIYSINVILIILMSLNFSYFIYRVLLQIEFFPFINLLAGILLLGIGSDDTFILRENFEKFKNHVNDLPLANILTKSLQKSTVSMLVTTLTTVSAIFFNFISHITAIKCFAIYASLCLLINFLLVITYLPALYIYQKKHTNCICKNFAIINSKIDSKYSRFQKLFKKNIEIVIKYFVTVIPLITCSFFLITFLISIFLLTYIPGLSLPNKEYFQYFRKDSIIEQFDLRYRNHFKVLQKKHDPIFIRILFGIEQIDYAPFLTPTYKNEKITLIGEGKQLLKDKNLEWINNYCNHISKQSFVMLNYNLFSLAPDLNYVFIDEFYNNYMKKNCTSSEEICCNKSQRPYHENLIQYCVSKMFYNKETSLSNKLTNQFWYPIGRPIFHIKQFSSKSNFNIYSIHQCAFLTKYTFSFDFWTMKNNYNQIISIIKQNLSEAPNEILKNPIIDLEQFRFYDMHSSLLTETLISTILGLLCAFIILWMSIKNTKITIFALIVIIDIVITTLSVMPFLNWHLNVVESTIILLTVGLSFDFVLHYSISYANILDGNYFLNTPSIERTNSISTITLKNSKSKSILLAINDVIYPIFVSAATTSVTGLAMSVASTLSFHQIGVFMITMATVSFIHSTFFLMSLLLIFVPPKKLLTSHTKDILIKRDKTSETLTPLINKNVNFIKYTSEKSRTSSQPNLTKIYTRRQSSNYPLITEDYINNIAGRDYLDRRFSGTSDDIATSLSLAKIAKSHHMIKRNSLGYVRRASLPVPQASCKNKRNSQTSNTIKMNVTKKKDNILDSMKEEN